MDPLLQRRIQRYGWDKAATYYELYWQRQLEPAQLRLLEMAALQSGELVLDIACGTGRLTFRMASLIGPQGEVFGADISDNMIAIASRAAAEKKIDNVRFERMDAEELSVPSAGYNAAICSLGLMYVTDALKAAREMHRSLKPGGRAVAAVWGQRSKCGWAEIVESRVASEVCPLFFQQGTGDTLANTFLEAGMVNVRSERLTVPLYYESSEEACGAAFIGGPVALAYSRFNDKMKKEAEADYLASIEPFRKGEGYLVPGEFVIVAGFKE